MIKRILVGLDPDEDTSYAIDYAIRIAKTCDAKITGLAVVDMAHIDSEASGGGIGSMYYGTMLREKLSEEARETANRLIGQFETSLKASDVEFAEVIEEGVPFQRIVEDMKYHDLLVLGKEPHFFYNKPKQRTDTLAKVVKDSTSPVLVITEQTRSIEKVLVAYDGSAPAARTMKQFAQQRPFGDNLKAEIVHVREAGNSSEEESQLLLNLAQSYYEDHGFETTTASLKASDGIAPRLTKHADEIGADLVVTGAHSVSRVKQWMFGSTTSDLLKNSPVPMFLYR